MMTTTIRLDNVDWGKPVIIDSAQGINAFLHKNAQDIISHLNDNPKQVLKIHLKEENRTYQTHQVKPGKTSSSTDTPTCGFAFERTYGLPGHFARFLHSIRNYFSPPSGPTHAKNFSQTLNIAAQSAADMTALLESSDAELPRSADIASKPSAADINAPSVRSLAPDAVSDAINLNKQPLPQATTNIWSHGKNHLGHKVAGPFMTDRDPTSPKKSSTCEISIKDIDYRNTDTHLSLTQPIKLILQLNSWKASVAWDKNHFASIKVIYSQLQNFRFYVTKSDLLYQAVPHLAPLEEKFISGRIIPTSKDAEKKLADQIKNKNNLALILTQVLNTKLVIEQNGKLSAEQPGRVHNLRFATPTTSTAIYPFASNIQAFLLHVEEFGNSMPPAQRTELGNKIISWLNNFNWTDYLRVRVQIFQAGQRPPVRIIIERTMGAYYSIPDIANETDRHDGTLKETKRVTALFNSIFKEMTNRQ